ncbi:hypothetical protein GGR55DRAFT_668829 [Xylaria sp. FL0064]|nr:hypothetical protein GGR55DRAFT_668829 [Xylaria sp. FL0064]
MADEQEDASPGEPRWTTPENPPDLDEIIVALDDVPGIGNLEDIRDKDVYHFWCLTCFWEDKFGTEDARHSYVLETRHGQAWFDKKRVSDWVMGLDISPCPMTLRSGRQPEIPPSPSESARGSPARKPKRPAQDKSQQSKSPKREQSATDHSDRKGSTKRKQSG